MRNTGTVKVIDLLAELDYITTEQATKAKESDYAAGAVSYLVENGIITEELVGQAIAEYYQIPYYQVAGGSIDRTVLKSVPQQIAHELRFVPLTNDGEHLAVATDSPQRKELIIEVLNDLFPGKKIEVNYTLPDKLDHALKDYQSTIKTRINEILDEGEGFASKMFRAIIDESINQNVSDIHLEPTDDNVRMRFRIDGSLVTIANITKEVYGNLVNHIKILAKLRIDQHYSPQDGAIRFKTDEHAIDLRISLVPLLEGEKTVIRILSNYARQLSLSELGLSEKNQKLVEKASKLTYGMILTAGPTGSGKTTTLYAILRRLNIPNVNITTIEDPVEYRVEGVNQIQVDRDNSVSFASGLRSIVRQDPNIILVGEIRDTETVEIAVNASLTGHLLLSSFHANDAASTIPRILEMGTEPFLLSSTLKLIIAQRLVRKTCTHCKVSKEYHHDELHALLGNPDRYFDKDVVRFYRGKGCERCNNTGFSGRVGIFELVYVSEQIQELILNRASSQEIWEVARSEGAVSFFQDGLEKVRKGTVSLEELIRVAPQHYHQQKIYE